jgi:hypothetical protein
MKMSVGAALLVALTLAAVPPVFAQQESIHSKQPVQDIGRAEKTRKADEEIRSKQPVEPKAQAEMRGKDAQEYRDAKPTGKELAK